jgi:hypothetical protein
MADSKKLHWTKTPEGKEKLRTAMLKAHAAKRQTKATPRKYTKRQPKYTPNTLIIEGWRITLDKDAIKIERE